MARPPCEDPTHMSRRALVVLALIVLAAACGTTVPLETRSEQGGNLAGTLDGSGDDGTRSGTGTGVGSGGEVAGPVTGAEGPTSVAPDGAGRSTGGTAAPAGPAKGRGYDEKNVYIGVSTAKDMSTATASFGLQSKPEDWEGYVKAVVRQ